MGIPESRPVRVVGPVDAGPIARFAQKLSPDRCGARQISLGSLVFVERGSDTVAHQAVSIAAVLTFWTAEPHRHVQAWTHRGSGFVTNRDGCAIFEEREIALGQTDDPRCLCRIATAMVPHAAAMRQFVGDTTKSEFLLHDATDLGIKHIFPALIDQHGFPRAWGADSAFVFVFWHRPGFTRIHRA